MTAQNNTVADNAITTDTDAAVKAILKRMETVKTMLPAVAGALVKASHPDIDEDGLRAMVAGFSLTDLLKVPQARLIPALFAADPATAMERVSLVTPTYGTEIAAHTLGLKPSTIQGKVSEIPAPPAPPTIPDPTAPRKVDLPTPGRGRNAQDTLLSTAHILWLAEHAGARGRSSDVLETMRGRWGGDLTAVSAQIPADLKTLIDSFGISSSDWLRLAILEKVDRDHTAEAVAVENATAADKPTVKVEMEEEPTVKVRKGGSKGGSKATDKAS